MQLMGRVFTAMFFAVLAVFFIAGGAGRAYGVGLTIRLRIVVQILRSAFGLGAVTLPNEQLYLANHILSMPRDLTGDVAELGCFKGRTSAILSIACKAVGRRLVIFDSFAGLPPTEHAVTELVSSEPVTYAVGEYAGSLDEVRATIARMGEISVCDFVPGLFEDSLARRSNQRWAMVFEDADLPSSVADAIRLSWRQLERGGTFFCHEARDHVVVAQFFDRVWWAANVGEPPPQFVGSGTGLPLAIGVRYGGGALSLFGSFLGYAVRR